MSKARSINCAEILTAHTEAAAEVAEVAAAEAAAAEAAAVGTTADALGAQTALAPELPKEPGGGANGMAEDAEEIPGRPVFSVGPVSASLRRRRREFCRASPRVAARPS